MSVSLESLSLSARRCCGGGRQRRREGKGRGDALVLYCRAFYRQASGGVLADRRADFCDHYCSALCDARAGESEVVRWSCVSACGGGSIIVLGWSIGCACAYAYAYAMLVFLFPSSSRIGQGAQGHRHEPRGHGT